MCCWNISCHELTEESWYFENHNKHCNCTVTVSHFPIITYCFAITFPANTHTFPQPPALNVQTFQIILLFIPPSISLSWCSVVDVRLTPLGGTRLWHHTWQQPEVSLGKIVVYEAQDSQSFLQISQQSCGLLLQIKTKRQREKQRNGIRKCCEPYSNLHRLHERHSSCANR